MEITESELIGVELSDKDHSIMIESDDQIELIVKALSSRTRRKILSEIRIQPMDVSRIARKLDMTEANISAQISKLAEANLIVCDYASGQHGVRKISRLKYSKIKFEF